MRDYRKFVRTRRTLVYALESPANMGDVDMILYWLREEYPQQAAYDDGIKIVAYDEEVHIVVELPSEETPVEKEGL